MTAPSTEVYAPGDDGSVWVGNEFRAPGAPTRSRRPFVLVVRDGDRTALVSLTRLQALGLAFKLCGALGVKLSAGDQADAPPPPWELQRDGDVFDPQKWADAVRTACHDAARRIAAQTGQLRDDLAARRGRPGVGQ